MFVTIKVSAYIFVQGLRSKVFPDGSVQVLVGKNSYTGMPV